MSNVVSIVIAAISFAGTLITAGVSAWYKWASDEQQRRNEAEKLISKYRDPLLLACQDLQSRLFNIADQNFAMFLHEGGDGDGDLRDNVLFYTAFLVGQYFSWTFILRRQAQFLRFSTDKANKDLTRALSGIVAEFGTSAYLEDGAPFMLWQGQQIAIGEVMTVDKGGEMMCLGYASFYQKFKDQADTLVAAPGPIKHYSAINWSGDFRHWFRPIIEAVRLLADTARKGNSPPDQRLRRLQHLLIDLINVLDKKGLRSEAKRTSRCHRAKVCNCTTCSGNDICPCKICKESRRPAQV